MDATDSDKHFDHNTRLTYVYKKFYNTGPKLPRLFSDKTLSLNLLNGGITNEVCSYLTHKYFNYELIHKTFLKQIYSLIY
jgi:hypothetical protein